MSGKHIQKSFLVDRSTGKRVCINGARESTSEPSKEFLRQNFSEHVLYTAQQLPPKVDLRPWMTRVERQSKLMSW